MENAVLTVLSQFQFLRNRKFAALPGMLIMAFVINTLGTDVFDMELTQEFQNALTGIFAALGTAAALADMKRDHTIAAKAQPAIAVG